MNQLVHGLPILTIKKQYLVNSMTLDTFNYQSVATTFGRHQKTLRLVVIVLLSLYLLAFLARLVWQFVPAPDMASAPASHATTPINKSAGQSGVNITQLQQLNLFGRLNQVPVQEPADEVTDAPETRLNLTLTGVVATSVADDATAIIENKGTQVVYGLGEKIEGTNATLRQVQADRVIIRNSGRDETLMLDGLDYDEANQRRQQVNRSRQRPLAPNNPPPEREARPQLSREAIEATASLREQPGDFTDFISISPYSEGGQLVGYQVKPGKNPALFQSAGLQAGDIIVQINGLDLTDTQQSMEAMNTLRSAQTIELTMTRDGEYLTVYLDMPEPGAE